MYILLPNSLGVRQMALIVRSLKHVHTFTELTRRQTDGTNRKEFNPLKPELNPICYLLALLGAHHFLHVSRIRVKSLTLR